MATHVDVAILGAGLAGLTLARHLLLQQPDLTILHLEKRAVVPLTRQKVGESNVQIQGYYLGKVLDLEETLYQDHLMKYNLRFLWPTTGMDASDIHSYSQSYIRNFSNIPCYQMDRNKLEGTLIELNSAAANYQLLTGVQAEVTLNEGEEPHRLTWADGTVTADWVIDSTGRSRVLARQLDAGNPAPFRHSAAYFWVDGTVNIEKLTKAGNAERRRHASRGAMGHLPFWLATNHFMGPGFWFWVIPLQGRTSFGLVFDNAWVAGADVNRSRKLKAWLDEHLPLFRDAFEVEDMIDFSYLNNYAHGCDNTIHRNRWAMSGESGRFTDPLYSPGGDLIALHNTLIVDAIATKDSAQRQSKIGRYETMLKIFYQSFLPSYDPGYGSLGDQEVFGMKYSWELSIYFAFFVFPFINDLFADRNFLIPYFRRLAALGDTNRKVHATLDRYSRWKQAHATPLTEPHFFDFTSYDALRTAERTFYKVNQTPKEAVQELEAQLETLQAMADDILKHMETTMAVEVTP